MTPAEIVNQFQRVTEICSEHEIPFTFNGSHFDVCGRIYESLNHVESMVEGMVLYKRLIAPLPEPEQENLDGNGNPHNPTDHSTKVTTQTI